MKNKKLIAAAVLIGFCGPVAADVYLGAKLGYLSPDEGDADATLGGSVVLGYELADVIAADFSVEGEYTQSLSEGDFDVDLPGAGDAEWDYRSLGLFAVARSGGPVYLRGRAGLVSNRFEVAGDSEEETGSAIGVGVGFSLLGLETSVDWTRYLDSGDLDAVDYLSLGMRF